MRSGAGPRNRGHPAYPLISAWVDLRRAHSASFNALSPPPFDASINQSTSHVVGLRLDVKNWIRSEEVGDNSVSLSPPSARPSRDEQWEVHRMHSIV
ncbi:hypothetical protein RRG08_043396 [Elysia crispata]|uniref:Uncharacterized protein n=1 Tax=Elysia crispata TaxID=231223 RepID=A0AAE1ATN0_9GAST|nr:hypothetical protein RRG08_043396 [Elysia crispata]